MNLLVDLLMSVRSGQLSFSPSDQSERALREFQLPARALIYAEEEGLVGRLAPHKNALYGERLYDLIVVVEGLTYRGELYLTDPDPKKNKQLEDIT